MVLVTSGVPRGCFLGPILFVYFINDMPDIVQCLIKMYYLLTTLRCILMFYQLIIIRILRNSINELVRWEIKINSGKCKVLHVGKNNPEHKYCMDGKTLKCTKAETDLGIMVDKNLNLSV